MTATDISDPRIDAAASALHRIGLFPACDHRAHVPPCARAAAAALAAADAAPRVRAAYPAAAVTAVPMAKYPMAHCLDGRHPAFNIEIHPSGCPAHRDERLAGAVR